jgi:tetratricopeptide (TPR) repeat protein
MTDNAEVHKKRGIVYCEKGEYDKAFADCTEAIRLKPDFAEAYNNRGKAYFYTDDYDKAIADYTEALRLDPDDAEYKRALAQACKMEFELAIADSGMKEWSCLAMHEARRTRRMADGI